MANILTQLRCSFLYGKAKARLKKGRADEAQACLERILASAQEAGDETLMALAHKFLAEFFLETGMTGKARTHAEESLLLFPRLGSDSEKFAQEKLEVERLLEKIENSSAEGSI